MQSFKPSMNIIGISTGALCGGDWRQAVAILNRKSVSAVELSALRLVEFDELAEEALSFARQGFAYVSFHAPSAFPAEHELEVVTKLARIVAHGFPVIAHPDCIRDFKCWRKLGDGLLIENMDKRKPFGRTVSELRPVFAKLPDARWCFDIGHAKQVDTTMIHASQMLDAFGDRLAEIHLSDVDASSKHHPLNEQALRSFRGVLNASQVEGIPIILETPVTEAELEKEIDRANAFLVSLTAVPIASGLLTVAA